MSDQPTWPAAPEAPGTPDTPDTPDASLDRHADVIVMRTAAKQRQDPAKPIIIKLDVPEPSDPSAPKPSDPSAPKPPAGRVLVFHRPKDSGWVLLQLAIDSGKMIDAYREMMLFLDQSLSKADRDYLADRLRDPDDDFDMNEIIELFRKVTAAWTGTPTGSQPG